jgi:hypothetical protein
MTNSEQLDFNFRYRPKVNSSDAILIRYLQTFKPAQRKELILKALRAFYLVPAHGQLANLDNLSSLEDLARSLKKTYGDDYDDQHSLGIEINLKIAPIDSWSMLTIKGNEDDEEDDY